MFSFNFKGETWMSERQVRALFRQAEVFRTLGRIIGDEETFKAKLDGTIAYGLAEVCELLAEAAKKEKNLRPEDPASCKHLNVTGKEVIHNEKII